MAVTLVSAGTVATGTASVTPAFGQATTAGNTLIGWYCGNNNVTPTTASAGWSGLIADFTPSGPAVGIFFKANCSAGESAPTFTSTGALSCFGMVAEFSGAGNTADQGGSNGGSASPRTATCGGVDAAAGELLVSVQGWNLTKAGTCTTADSYNNGATPQTNASNDATSTAFHYRFAWGATTGNTAADSDVGSNNSMNLSNGLVTIGSLKTVLTPASATYLRAVLQAVNRAAIY